jgi:hypothetical protein
MTIAGDQGKNPRITFRNLPDHSSRCSGERSRSCWSVSWQSKAHFRLGRECVSPDFPKSGRSVAVGQLHLVQRSPQRGDPHQQPKEKHRSFLLVPV